MERTVVAFRYTGTVAEVVGGAKASSRADVWRRLGGLLGGDVTAAALRPEALTWVPASRPVRRRRGYDHAERLAEGVGRTLGVRAQRLLEAAPGRPDQAARPAAVRRMVPVDAFTAVGPASHADVLVVDDVLTTGATLHRAVATLAGRGWRVHVAVLARAGTSSLYATDAPRVDRDGAG